MSALVVATLIIYIILIQPTLYCLWCHGKRGFLGWFYLQTFCILRIVGSIVELHEGHPNVYLSSLGLAQLLLTVVGILHEARSARNPGHRRKLGWFLVLNYHVVVSAATGVVVVGIVKMNNGSGVKGAADVVGMGSGKNLVKIGRVILMLCGAVLFPWTLESLRRRQRHTVSASYADGTKLLYGVVATLPFVACREIYAAGVTFIKSPQFASSFAAKVGLSVVPEMMVTTIFVVAGILTRNIPKARREVKA